MIHIIEKVPSFKNQMVSQAWLDPTDTICYTHMSQLSLPWSRNYRTQVVSCLYVCPTQFSEVIKVILLRKSKVRIISNVIESSYVRGIFDKNLYRECWHKLRFQDFNITGIQGGCCWITTLVLVIWISRITNFYPPITNQE